MEVPKPSEKFAFYHQLLNISHFSDLISINVENLNLQNHEDIVKDTRILTAFKLIYKQGKIF